MSLRPDNADQRLTRKGYKTGCVSEERMSRTERTLSKLQENIQLLKSEVKSSIQWRKLLKLRSSKNVHVKSAFEMLNLADEVVTTDMLISALPDRFGHLAGDPIVSRRLQVCSCYRIFVRLVRYVEEPETSYLITSNISLNQYRFAVDYYDQSIDLLDRGAVRARHRGTAARGQ